MKTLVMYGIGDNCRRIEEEIDNQKYIVVAYTDGISDIDKFNSRPFIKRDRIGQVKYDYIVVTIWNEIVRTEAINFLLVQQNIPKEKIIDYYNYKKVDRVIQTCKDPYEGVVLGMSYAEVGILPSKFPFKCCNLAVSSQDIFHNYKTLKYCYEYYKDKFNLKYLIIDMYDDRWLNIDISKTKNIYPYICQWHGYRDVYDLENNLNISYEEKKQINEIADYGNDMHIFNAVEYNGEVTKENRNNCIINKKYEREDVGKEHYQCKKYVQTIIENKICFDKMLELARKFNPNIKIICLFLPRFFQMELLIKSNKKLWKEDFQYFIKEMEKKYNIEFYNLQENKELCYDYRFFWDLEHLNYEGANRVTSYIIENIIKR